MLTALSHSFFSVRHLSAWVEVDGEPLRVYGAERDGKLTTGFVEVKEGQQFAVRWADLRMQKPEDSYSMVLWVDGWDVNGTFIDREWTLFDKKLESSHRVQTYHGAQESTTCERAFTFAPLATTRDDSLALDDEEMLEQLGTIALSYVRGTGALEDEEDDGSDLIGPEDEVERLVHEDQKQGGVSMQINYGSAISKKQRPTIKPVDLDNRLDPFSEVTFFYRSRARPPSSVPPALPKVDVQPPTFLSQTPTSPAADDGAVRLSGAPAPPATPPARSSTSARFAAENDTDELERELARLKRDRRIEELEEGIARRKKKGIEGMLKKVKKEAADGSSDGPTLEGTESGKMSKGKGKARAVEEIDLTKED
ncbi:hypothetical protein JCM10213v2_008829 [Rhodosporidiobolus nylandii]